MLTKFYDALIAIGTFLQSFFLLGVRLFWGWQFFMAGFGKFANIESIADYFQTLGISPPLLQAYAASSTELVCGALLLIGLGSRLVAIPLMVIMTVALLTAHHEATSMILDDPLTFIKQEAFSFLFAALIIFVFGPGKISVDAIIKKIRGRA